MQSFSERFKCLNAFVRQLFMKASSMYISQLLNGEEAFNQFRTHNNRQGSFVSDQNLFEQDVWQFECFLLRKETFKEVQGVKQNTVYVVTC